jgi:hypothetical protein
MLTLHLRHKLQDKLHSVTAPLGYNFFIKLNHSLFTYMHVGKCRSKKRRSYGLEVSFKEKRIS